MVVARYLGWFCYAYWTEKGLSGDHYKAWDYAYECLVDRCADDEVSQRMFNRLIGIVTR